MWVTLLTAGCDKQVTQMTSSNWNLSNSCGMSVTVGKQCKRTPLSTGNHSWLREIYMHSPVHTFYTGSNFIQQCVPLVNSTSTFISSERCLFLTDIPDFSNLQ